MSEEQGAELGYLCIDRFVADIAGARALASALELGLIDRLLAEPACALHALGAHARLDVRATRLLAGMLRTNDVIRIAQDEARLTEEFRAALRYRDLLEAKLDFAARVAPDFLSLFTTLLSDPEGFFAQAKLFELFSYDRCFDSTPENLAATARWMRFTTALTRYEAGACLDAYDFSAHGRVLDVGGNSGEFALRICRRHSAIRATVFDLPVVCDIGMAHVRGESEAARIDFVKAGRSEAPLPQGYDLVSFKSMLHDWPEEAMLRFLARAHAALRPGGTVLIYERGPFQAGDAPMAYAQIPIMLFFRSYRAGSDYAEPLRQAGFRDIEMRTLELDMPFLLVTARK